MRRIWLYYILGGLHMLERCLDFGVRERKSGISGSFAAWKYYTSSIDCSAYWKEAPWANMYTNRYCLVANIAESKALYKYLKSRNRVSI